MNNIKTWIRYITLREIKDLLLASIIIAFIVSFTSLKALKEINFYYVLTIAFFVLSLSFILHELAHKFTALKHGMFAQFEISYSGLLFSLVLKLLAGITIIIPGAVMIYRHYYHKSRKKDIAIQGVISLAGPLVNMALSILAYLFYVIIAKGSFAEILYLLAYVNALLLLFNLLPVPPLDGFKIARWSLWIYIPLFVFSLIWFYFGF